MGKTAVLDKFASVVSELPRMPRVTVVRGQGDAAYKQIQLYPWRQVYRQLLKVDRHLSNEGG